jgi:hypothetical protein
MSSSSHKQVSSFELSSLTALFGRHVPFSTMNFVSTLESRKYFLVPQEQNLNNICD